jgi:hypothetical protein
MTERRNIIGYAHHEWLNETRSDRLCTAFAVTSSATFAVSTTLPFGRALISASVGKQFSPLFCDRIKRVVVVSVMCTSSWPEMRRVLGIDGSDVRMSLNRQIRKLDGKTAIHEPADLPPSLWIFATNAECRFPGPRIEKLLVLTA